MKYNANTIRYVFFFLIYISLMHFHMGLYTL